MVDRQRTRRRNNIQTSWGILGGTRADWQESEHIAMRILDEIGFDDIRLLNYFPHCPFDISAKILKQTYVFQVTTRTHVDDYKRHIQLAEDLGLIYMILYIKPDLSGYVLRGVYESGFYELRLKDMKAIKRMPN